MEIEFKKSLFSDVHYPIIANKDRYLILWGGRDSTKSYSAAQKLIIECLRMPYFRCIMVKKTYESIKDAQWQTIKDIIYHWKLEDLFTFSKSPLEINCVNGNKFLARGCDKPEKLKSIKDPSHVWYEEGNQLSYEDFITITTTVRSTEAEYLQEIFSFNPEHLGELKDFWIYKQWFENKDQKSFKGDIEIELEDEKASFPYTVIHSTYKDNEYCTPQRKAILEGLKLTNPYYYSVFTLGEWGVKEVESPYITAFEEDKHVNDVAVFVPKKQFIMSFDFNVDNTTVLFCHIGNDYMHFFDEMTANNLPDLLKKIKIKYGKYLSNCLITGDRSGQNRTHMISDNMNSYRLIKNTLKMQNRQLKVITNPPHKENRLTCNIILANHPNVYFHSKLKNTIFDLKYVECDQEQRIIKKDRNIANQRGDFLDDFRYICNTFKKAWVKNYRV
jgi:phage terminase large subunit